MANDRFLLKELSRYNLGTFANIIYRNALLYPQQEAFVYGKTRITFSEFNSRANKIIRALQRMGVKKGDVVGILSWNCLQEAEVLGAALKAGFISSPFNPRLKSDEIIRIVDYSEASTLFVGAELLEMADSLRPRLGRVKNFICLEGSASDMTSHDELLASESGEEPDADVHEDDPVGIIYTSGTTGLPRGALYTSRGFMEDTKNLLWDLGLESGQRHLQITPLFHAAGYAFFRTFLYASGCNVIHKFFDPAAALKAIQEEKVGYMLFVPTQLAAMLNVPDVQKYDTRSLKFMWYGASAMPVELLKRGIEVFGHVFGQGYGQSESGPGASHLSKEDHNVVGLPQKEQKRLSSIGRPDISVHLRIVADQDKDLGPGEVGEIIVRSKQIMQEYWRRPEDTKANIVGGWLHTGDMGYYDEKGYVYIVDRKKEMIISGGEHIYPREVEEVFCRHPAVADVAVIGLPDPYWVERAHAVIVLKAGASATPTELIDFCRQNIAGYKVPKTIEFAEDLPRNAAGKVLKRVLKERLTDSRKAV
jgi:acyl-CoA synthetase (AMP-forming)/AMP-acid ligase II